MKHSIFAFVLMGVGIAAGQTDQATVASPNSQLSLTVATVSGQNPSAEGQLSYRVTFRGQPVFAWSRLAMEIQNQPLLGDRMRITAVKPSQVDETYTLVHGKANPVRNRANAITVELTEAQRPGRRLTIEARAYDDGIAFRYIIPNQSTIKELRLANERTAFAFAKEPTTYPLILQSFRTSYEDDYHRLPLTAIHPAALVALPLLTEIPGVAWVAITEANIDNYAGMYLTHTSRNPRALESQLAPRADVPGISVSGLTPVQSPWRVLMIADQPGRLIESNLVVNLNPPCAIKDTSWIKAGKTSWDWWSGHGAKNVDFKPGMNNETMKYFIDFSAKAKLEYMLVDAGWAARGTGPNDSGADITRSIPQIDIPELVRYAKAKDVRIWVWCHWTDIDRLMDAAFPLYEQWGVAGVKIDFMDRDDQWMVDFYHRVLKKAAEHHLMIDFHGAYKPDGMRRTYPNLMTQEGVMGLEYSKWSARITPEHNLMLAFTRLLAGPMDYTPGGFDNVTREAFEPRNRMPDIMGTRAHQLALYVVYESPLQMLADYPGAYEGQKELAFLSAVPATWDETRVLSGKPEDHVTVARRRGKEWYIGSITGWRPNEHTISLEFLGAGEYMAEIYADAPDADRNPKNTTLEQKKVNARSTLRLKLASGGGQAIRIRPL